MIFSYEDSLLFATHLSYYAKNDAIDMTKINPKTLDTDKRSLPYDVNRKSKYPDLAGCVKLKLIRKKGGV